LPFLRAKKAIWNKAYHFFYSKTGNTPFKLIIKHNMIYSVVIEAFQNQHKYLKISYLCKKNLHIYFKLS